MTGGPGYRALRLADVEAVPWPGGLTWHPVRSALGLRAFGAGGFSAARAGDVVVEPHTEEGDGRGHHELYVVLRGRATFRLDGEAVDAPAGTLVFVGDPAVHREAVAAEPGTEVLALGGPPVFEPAGSEWLMRARPLMAARPEQARAVLDEGLHELPESAAVRFGLALLAAEAGDGDAARRWWAEAVAREPRLAEELAREPRLAALVS